MLQIIQKIPEMINKNFKRSSEFTTCVTSKSTIYYKYIGMLESYEKVRVNISELKEMPWLKSNNFVLKSKI